ncbi:MAG: diadenylate cyclase, partial [Kiritimatiellia bacterium]
MSWLYVWVQDSALTTATPVDWVDIGVLSWLFYQIFLFLRGTRAMQSLIGIAVLGLVYLLSDLVGLTSLNWVLDNFFGWVVLALIILFQEDIRRALARAGGTIFSRTTKASDAQVLEELVKACFRLAKRRVGALV